MSFFVVFFIFDILIRCKTGRPSMNAQIHPFVRLFGFDYKRYLFSFFLIVERPNLIVLEYMANGALDKYLQVKSQKINLHLVRMYLFQVFTSAQRKSRELNFLWKFLVIIKQVNITFGNQLNSFFCDLCFSKMT